MTREQQSAARYRAVALADAVPAVVHSDVHGVLHVRSAEPLAPYPERLLDRLVEGARKHPERTFIARREAGEEWRRISYAAMLQSTRTIAQSLLSRELSRERPIAILSANDLEHAQLAFAAMWLGIPYSPVSAAYSLLSKDFGKLREVLATLTPGLVFASDAASYGAAISACVPPEVEVVLGRGQLPGRAATSFATLLEVEPTEAVDRAFLATGPDTLLKLLFTSGSTRSPKAVETTNRMLSANQQMILQTLPFLRDEPPIQVDWLPWNHTFGGSHNIGIALYNGGTYYIDDGKPTPTAFQETLRNLKEVAPTVYFTVPKAWEDLALALAADAALAQNFFSQVKLFMYAGAGLSQAAWDRLDAIAERTTGERIRMITGLGMTEASPTCTFTLGPVVRSGYVGLPVPGCEMKLVPVADKREARFSGPHITPGYFRNPAQSKEAFDRDGFYCTGDALKPLDEQAPELGFLFDGRLAEDFKLSSGTFVSVGPLRAKIIAEGAPYVQDVVVAGLNRAEIAVLIFPRIDECKRLSGLDNGAASPEVLASAPVQNFFQGLLDRVHGAATGSANRVACLHLLREPPSIDKAEITDKNSINQRAVLSQRAALVEAIYEGSEQAVLRPSRRA